MAFPNKRTSSSPTLLDQTLSPFSWWKWCIPAILVGFVLRALLLTEWPRAFYWPDSKDALYTAKRWYENYALSIHYKKTWLPPISYLFTSFLPGGVLNWAAWIQHALGVFSILFVGGICRTWMSRWRWWIIPVTTLVAVNPSLIIWEHSIMQEPWFMPAVLFAAWQTGYFIHEPTWKRFIWLAISVLLCAATRPEGKLFAAILVLALALIGWQRRELLKKAAICTVITCLVISLTGQKGQAGLLLMTSLVPFTPEKYDKFPGLAEKLHPIRDQLAAQPNYKTRIPSAKTRREVSSAFKEYIKETTGKSASDPGIEKLCKKVARSTALMQWDKLPNWMWLKFRRVAHEQPTCTWEDRYVIEDQIEALGRDPDMVKYMRHHLLGRPVPELENLEDWIKSHTKSPGPEHWMNRWTEWWDENLLSWRLEKKPKIDPADDLHGVPWFKIIALLGMGISILGATRQHQIQWLFATTLFAILLAVLLSANIKPRFLFFIEPFWFIYPFLALDSLLRIAFRKSSSGSK